jgi:RHS repeat-associated protein
VVTTNSSGTTASLSLADLAGSVVASVAVQAGTDASALSGFSSFDEYGNPTSTGAQTGVNDYGWEGGAQRAATNAGLTLMGARVYNSTTGRFTSPDPVAGGNENAYNYPDDPVGDSDLGGESALVFGIPSWAIATEEWLGSAAAIDLLDDWNPSGWAVDIVLALAAGIVFSVAADQALITLLAAAAKRHKNPKLISKNYKSKSAAYGAAKLYEKRLKRNGGKGWEVKFHGPYASEWSNPHYHVYLYHNGILVTEIHFRW